MNLQETAYWLDGLFPGDLKFSRINGLHIASIDLSSEDTTEALACTADFGRVDTGLVSSEEAFEDRGVEKQVEVRSEIFCVASAEPEVVERAVVAAASFLAESNTIQTGIVPAQPGQLLPAVGVFGGLAEMPGIEVRHGLLVAPYVWSDGVPRMREDDRITTMLQLVMLTDDEYEYATTYGVDELQEAMVNEGVNILDLCR